MSTLEKFQKVEGATTKSQNPSFSSFSLISRKQKEFTLLFFFIFKEYDVIVLSDSEKPDPIYVQQHSSSQRQRQKGCSNFINQKEIVSPGFIDSFYQSFRTTIIGK
jgi:hypothetical protein